MKLIIAGIGFDDLITLRALRAAESADIIIVPRSHENTEGYAERFITELVPDRKYIHIHFPMVSNPEKRDAEILSQLAALKPELEKAGTIFFPVIGDSMLYSTGEYLQEAITKLFPEIETEFTRLSSERERYYASYKSAEKECDELKRLRDELASYMEAEQSQEIERDKKRSL